MEVAKPRVNVSPEPSVTLVTSNGEVPGGEKFRPTMSACPVWVGWGRVKVIVLDGAGCRLKVAFWIREMEGGAVIVNPFANVAVWPSGVVTVMLRAPKDAVGETL